MRELQRASYGKAAALFDDFPFHKGHLGAVLLGALPGRVFVDDLERPKGAVIWPGDGFQYLACEAGRTEAFLTDCAPLFGKEGSGACLELVAGDAELESRIALAFGGMTHFTVPRLSFEAPASPPEAPALPPRFAIGLEREAHRLRLVLRETETGAEAGFCAAWIYHGEAETDIAIREDLRGKGLGKALGAAYLGLCAREGLKPAWTCWEDKEASRRLALALGFHDPKVFLVHIHDEG